MSLLQLKLEYKDLKRLIGEDQELETHISEHIIESFCKAHIYSKIAELISQKIQFYCREEVETYFGIHNVKNVSTDTIDKLIFERTSELVKASFEKTINHEAFKNVVEKCCQKYIHESLQKEVDNILSKIVEEKLKNINLLQFLGSQSHE